MKFNKNVHDLLSLLLLLASSLLFLYLKISGNPNEEMGPKAIQYALLTGFFTWVVYLLFSRFIITEVTPSLRWKLCLLCSLLSIGILTFIYYFVITLKSTV